MPRWRPRSALQRAWWMACCACPSASSQWKICAGIWQRRCSAPAAERRAHSRPLKEGGNMTHRSRNIGAAGMGLLLAAGLLIGAEQPPAGPASGWSTEQDHQDMRSQLGITKLRPGRNANADAPNAANYDEALANPYPDLPEVLRLENGRAVTSARQWQEQRRPEIIELFEREVIGRVPANVPAVHWQVADTATGEMAARPVN